VVIVSERQELSSQEALTASVSAQCGPAHALFDCNSQVSDDAHTQLHTLLAVKTAKTAKTCSAKECSRALGCEALCFRLSTWEWQELSSVQIAAFSKAFITTYSIITLQFHCFPRIFRRIPSRTKNQFGAPQADLPTCRHSGLVLAHQALANLFQRAWIARSSMRIWWWWQHQVVWKMQQSWRFPIYDI